MLRGAKRVALELRGPPRRPPPGRGGAHGAARFLLGREWPWARASAVALGSPGGPNERRGQT